MKAPARLTLVTALVALAAALAGCQGKKLNWESMRKKVFGPSTSERVIAVESTSADERREALEAIVKDKDARDVESVVRLYCLVARTDADPMVRSAAVRGLAQLEGDDVVPTLCHVIETDKDPYVRTDAAHALGHHEDAAAVEALLDALQGDEAIDVRVAAAESLRLHKNDRAANALAKALESRDLGVAYAAWESLRHMTGQDLPRKTDPWTEFLASADDPFADYGRGPDLPCPESQRPHFTQGVTDFMRGLFEKDPLQEELD